MTPKDKNTLKGYFNTGDIPTESEFANLIDSMERTFYPEDYGAIGDGLTDDTVAFQAAINAASVSGGIVRADKIYGISYTGIAYLADYTTPYGLWVNANNVHIVGSGKILPLSNSHAYSIIIFGNGGAPHSHPGELGTWTYDVGIFGITFDGSALITTHIVDAVAFFYVKGFYAINCRIINLTGYGIAGWATQRYGKICNNTIIGNPAGVDHNVKGINLDGAGHCVITGNYIEMEYSAGINLQANLDNGVAGVAKFNLVSNNIIYSTYNYGITFTGCQNSIISNNYIRGYGPALGLNSFAQLLGEAESSNNLIVGNYLVRLSTGGIAIQLTGYNSDAFDHNALPCRNNFFSDNFFDNHWVSKISFGQQCQINVFTETNVWIAPGTFTADDVTPSITGFNIWKTANVNPTTITMLDNGYVGQRLTVIINDAVTTIDFTGTNLKGNAGADWSPANGDFMDCIFDGTNWYCAVHDAT